jgi:hypothetical protein
MQVEKYGGYNSVRTEVSSNQKVPSVRAAGLQKLLLTFFQSKTIRQDD